MNGQLNSAHPGIGKSQGSPPPVFAHVVAESRGFGRACVAIMAGPTRHQTSQWAKQARDQGLTNVFEVYGRNESNCREHKRCTEVGSLGFEPMAVVCASCKHHPIRATPQYPACTYIESLEKAALSNGPRLIFCCFEGIQTIIEKLRDKGVKVSVIVFDEDPSRYFSLRHSLKLSSRMPSSSLPGVSESGHDVLWNQGRALFSVLNTFGTELLAAGDNGRATCGVLYRRLEEIATEQHPPRQLSDLLQLSVEYAFDELATATRKGAISSGVHTLRGNAARPWLSSMIRVMREEYAIFKQGTENWNHRIVGRIENGEPVLSLGLNRSLPRVDKVIVLDATGSVDRLRQLMPQVAWTVNDPVAQTPEFTTVHVRCCASRRLVAGDGKDKLLSQVAEAAKRFARNAKKILVVTYGNQEKREWQQELSARVHAVVPTATVVDAHFGELRGSNEYIDHDVVITVGDNEPPPFGLLDEIAPLFAGDPVPLSLEQEEFAGHRRYKDPRVRAWAERHTVEELTQVAHRHRPCIYQGRTYIHFGLCFPDKFLGRPTLSIAPRQFEAERAQSSMRDFFRRHGWLCEPLLIAVGYAANKADLGSPILQALQSTYGVEFVPITKPYSERQLRNVRNSIVGSQKRFTVRCPPELIIGERICGWGDKAKFEAEFQWILQRATCPEIEVNRPKIEGRDEIYCVKSA
ncbi:MAG: hypothetical protein WCT04_07575 [Planctomycetota bacterium]